MKNFICTGSRTLAQKIFFTQVKFKLAMIRMIALNKRIRSTVVCNYSMRWVPKNQYLLLRTISQQMEYHSHGWKIMHAIGQRVPISCNHPLAWVKLEVAACRLGTQQLKAYIGVK